MNNKRNLYETTIGRKIDIQEATDKNSNIYGHIRCCALKADTVNKNNRCYEEPIVIGGVQAFRETLKASKALGQLEHSPDHTQLPNVSHLIYHAEYYKPNKEFLIEADVLKTSRGRDLWVLLQEDAPIGCSVAGTGTTTRRGDGVEYVNKDWCVQRVDIVSSPSFGDATKVSKKQIFESVQFRPDETVTIAMFFESRQAGKKWSYEEFLDHLAEIELRERRHWQEEILAGFERIKQATKHK
jgi:hypothetical protein